MDSKLSKAPLTKTIVAWMRRKVLNERGAAMFVVLALLLIMTIIGVATLETSVDEATITQNSRRNSETFYVAEAGVALAKATLWNQYFASSMSDPVKPANDAGNLAAYSAFLTNMGVMQDKKSTILSDHPMDTQHKIASVTVDRIDIPGGVILTIKSTGADFDGATSTVTEVVTIGGALFSGFDFAILSKNVNCIMCHLKADNVDRVFNTDPLKQDTYDRVKIASLESMLIRTTSAESFIAGTLYTRGNITDKDGVPITDLSPTNKGVGGYKFDNVSGHISEPLATTKLTTSGSNPPTPLENLYLNYPTDEADMTDGKLPTTFPPPFADTDGDQMVDQSEFDVVADNALGSISGGVIYTVPNGATYTTGAFPGSSNTTSISQDYKGNVILVGTVANPIILNKDVAIDGDVIIRGVVKGTGQILARGNVYVVGDVTYADGVNGSGGRSFGQSADGVKNALSVAAGGNILVGDYLTPSGGNINSATSIDPGNLVKGEKFSFTMSEITLFNRMEWTKTQATLPDSKGAKVTNSTYVPGYKPRYYAMGDGDPVYIYNKPKVVSGKATGTYWDVATNTWKGSEHISGYDTTLATRITQSDPALSNATVVELSSNNNWISETDLKKLNMIDEASRASGQSYKFDGQLYTNNSIFALARSGSKSKGIMDVNGSLVSADMGILTAGGLNLNYDTRLKEFLKIKDDSDVEFTRLGWYEQ